MKKILTTIQGYKITQITVVTNWSSNDFVSFWFVADTSAQSHEQWRDACNFSHR